MTVGKPLTVTLPKKVSVVLLSTFMLHVLTGTHKGRKLKVPKGQKIRPTTSRVKKSIFDRLGDISGVRVLDVFAGSGGLGIESLSRGSSHVTFVEKDSSVFKILLQNLSVCGFADRSTLICSDYEDALKSLCRGNHAFDLIFIDPPYKLYENKEVSDFILLASNLLSAGGIIVIEHDHKIDYTPPGFERLTKPFGGTHVSYFTRRD